MTNKMKQNNKEEKKMNKIINTIGNDGCPCGEYDDGRTVIYAHCWKSNGYYNQKTKKYCNCEYACVHYKGNLKTAERIAKEIEERYKCEVKVVKL